MDQESKSTQETLAVVKLYVNKNQELFNLKIQTMKKVGAEFLLPRKEPKMKIVNFILNL